MVTTSALETRNDAYRARLLDGMATALADHRYHDVTIGDIVRHARTSRRTFYQLFADRDECYFALLRAVHAEMLGAVTGALGPAMDWREQVRSAITAFYRSVQAHPAVVRSWVRDMPSLGDPAVTRSHHPRVEFSGLLISLSQAPALREAGVEPVSDDLARFVVGGLAELTATVVENERDIDEVIAVAVRAVTRLITPAAAD